jgi:hypothetical protein
VRGYELAAAIRAASPRSKQTFKHGCVILVVEQSYGSPETLNESRVLQSVSLSDLSGEHVGG